MEKKLKKKVDLVRFDISDLDVSNRMQNIDVM